MHQLSWWKWYTWTDRLSFFLFYSFFLRQKSFFSDFFFFMDHHHHHRQRMCCHSFHFVVWLVVMILLLFFFHILVCFYSRRFPITRKYGKRRAERIFRFHSFNYKFFSTFLSLSLSRWLSLLGKNGQNKYMDIDLSFLFVLTIPVTNDIPL